MAARTQASGDPNTSLGNSGVGRLEESIQLESNRRVKNVQRKQKRSTFASWHSEELPVGAASQRKELYEKCSDYRVLFRCFTHRHRRGASWCLLSIRQFEYRPGSSGRTISKHAGNCADWSEDWQVPGCALFITRTTNRSGQGLSRAGSGKRSLHDHG